MLTYLQKGCGRVVSDWLARVSNGYKTGLTKFHSEKYSELNNLSECVSLQVQSIKSLLFSKSVNR